MNVAGLQPGNNFEKMGNNLKMTGWRCPVCGDGLVPEYENKCFVCRGNAGSAKHHSFDIARQGYVNLLLPNQKGSTDPGDSKMMVKARTDFLDAGYYQPFSDAINRICKEMLDGKSGIIADAGCGEGYYTKRLASSLPDCEIRGFDLARDAVSHGASSARLSQINNVRFGVASLFDMPLSDGAAEGVICLFAPVAEGEFARIVKKNGFLVIGVPGEDHLFGLKSAIYSEPYRNALRRDELSLFEPVSVERVSYGITLRTNEDIKNLFRMTPYYWKTSEADMAKLDMLDTLETEVCFDLLAYRRK